MTKSLHSSPESACWEYAKFIFLSFLPILPVHTSIYPHFISKSPHPFTRLFVSGAVTLITSVCVDCYYLSVLFAVHQPSKHPSLSTAIDIVREPDPGSKALRETNCFQHICEFFLSPNSDETLKSQSAPPPDTEERFKPHRADTAMGPDMGICGCNPWTRTWNSTDSTKHWNSARFWSFSTCTDPLRFFSPYICRICCDTAGMSLAPWNET